MKDNVPEEEYEIYNNWGSGMGKSGRADLEIMYNGRTWYVEAKDPKGRLSNVQRIKVAKMKHMGVPVYVIDDIAVFESTVWLHMNVWNLNKDQ